MIIQDEEYFEIGFVPQYCNIGHIGPSHEKSVVAGHTRINNSSLCSEYSQYVVNVVHYIVNMY